MGLGSSTLIEKSTRVPLGLKHLRLCRPGESDPKKACKTPIQLAGQSVQTLVLRIAGDFNHPGTYEGAVQLATPEDSDGESVSLTVYVTSGWQRFWGVMVILAGVLLFWFITVYTRSRLTHHQALVPAVLLREKFDDLDTRLVRVPAPFLQELKATRREIGAARARLEPKQLSPYLPPPIQSLFGSTAPRPGYEALLQELEQKLKLLAVVVREGLEPLLQLWDHYGHPPAGEPDLRKALQDVDGLSDQTPAPDLAQARGKIGQVRDWLDQQLSGLLRKASAALAAEAPAAPELSFAQLSAEITRLNVAVWVVWALLSVVAGSAALAQLRRFS